MVEAVIAQAVAYLNDANYVVAIEALEWFLTDGPTWFAVCDVELDAELFLKFIQLGRFQDAREFKKKRKTSGAAAAKNAGDDTSADPYISERNRDAHGPDDKRRGKGCYTQNQPKMRTMEG